MRVTCLRKIKAGYAEAVVIFGLVLLILGTILNLAILWTVGIIVILVGAALLLLGRSGHGVGGRSHYW